MRKLLKVISYVIRRRTLPCIASVIKRIEDEKNYLHQLIESRYEGGVLYLDADTITNLPLHMPLQLNRFTMVCKVASDADSTVFVLYGKQGPGMENHKHNYPERLTVIKGSVLLSNADDVFPLKEDEVFDIPAYSKHHVSHETPQVVYTIRVNHAT